MTDRQELLRLAELPERIAKRIAAEPATGCWNWTSPNSLVGRGRGYVSLKGKPVLHHRAVWTLLVGEVPPGAYLCHHCDNPRCCNPAHLYVGDSQTNVRDMWDRGRHWTQREPERARAVNVANGKMNTWARGVGNPKAKLSPQQARAIVQSTEKNRALAEAYGVHITTIQRIRKGMLWAS